MRKYDVSKIASLTGLLLAIGLLTVGCTCYWPFQSSRQTPAISPAASAEPVKLPAPATYEEYGELVVMNEQEHLTGKPNIWGYIPALPVRVKEMGNDEYSWSGSITTVHVSGRSNLIPAAYSQYFFWQCGIPGGQYAGLVWRNKVWLVLTTSAAGIGDLDLSLQKELTVSPTAKPEKLAEALRQAVPNVTDSDVQGLPGAWHNTPATWDQMVSALREVGEFGLVLDKGVDPHMFSCSSQKLVRGFKNLANWPWQAKVQGKTVYRFKACNGMTHYAVCQHGRSDGYLLDTPAYPGTIVLYRGVVSKIRDNAISIHAAGDVPAKYLKIFPKDLIPISSL